ncbi:cilia- and flagella-associated protein 410-like [Littorina saxatilis]|uniref:cilia- and flagella-associated protein 410-like n=1 Tax=Littorina saxatilis TaxID=31220 RepID=UPI0038B5D98F
MAMSETERNPHRLTEALVLARTRASDLESVRKLNCWASQIQDASIVRKMPNLEVCSLSVNNLSSLEDFSHCTNLQELYIRKNRVGSLTDVVYLKELEKLRVLWLANNPCSQGDNYRMTVLRTLPNLQKLDNVVVTEEEINKALEDGDDLTSDDANSNNANGKPTSNHCSTSLDPLSDNEYKEEEEDSGVEASANHLQPERSKGGPSFGISVSDLHKNRLQQQQDSVKLSWEETNQIRAQLGLKPLPMSKVTTNKSVTTGATKARNANVLQSVLLLIRELDKDSLEVVHNSVQRRLEDL